MDIEEHLKEELCELIGENEEWLMMRILHYAIQHNYAAYTSTLAEPWRLSIHGLSKPIMTSLGVAGFDYELNPDEDYAGDPVAAFGILEAKRHRQRGISIAMFLGLFKYYRQSYLDLLSKHTFTEMERSCAENILHRLFDRIELGLCSEWTSGSDAEKIEELQVTNRLMTNEKNKYLTLFESLHTPVFLLDAAGHFDRINKAATEWVPAGDNRFYSIDSDIETINRSLHGKKYDDIIPWLKGIIYRLSEDCNVITEHKRVSHNDQEMEIDVLCSAMQDVSQKFSGFVLIFSDRTKELNMLSEIQAMHVQRLQASKLEAIGQLAAGIAHEINTPSQYVSDNIAFLNEGFTEIADGVKSLCERVKSKPLSTDDIKRTLDEVDWAYLEEEVPKAIDQASDGMSRITSIVQAMKNFSHPGGAEVESADINNLIEVTSTVSRNEWKYCADLVLDLAPDLPEVPINTNEINQVLLNFIVNAAHAIKEKHEKTSKEGEKGKIIIKTAQKKNSVAIIVSDTGCGISEKIKSKIFDPFFTTKTVGCGTGQGLAIIYDVIKRKHGGDLYFDSEVGKGTTFTVSLPLNRKTLS